MPHVIQKIRFSLKKFAIARVKTIIFTANDRDYKDIFFVQDLVPGYFRIHTLSRNVTFSPKKAHFEISHCQGKNHEFSQRTDPDSE